MVVIVPPATATPWKTMAYSGTLGAMIAEHDAGSETPGLEAAGHAVHGVAQLARRCSDDDRAVGDRDLDPESMPPGAARTR